MRGQGDYFEVAARRGQGDICNLRVVDSIIRRVQ